MQPSMRLRFSSRASTLRPVWRSPPRRSTTRDVLSHPLAAADTLSRPAGKPYNEAALGEALSEDYDKLGKRPPSGRLAGVVFHPTSLDGPHGTGDLGNAFQFIDWLQSAGLKAWQVLPLVPPDPLYFSPYSGEDALCGSPLLISLEGLVRQGLLDAADLPKEPVPNPGLADFKTARARKLPLIAKAADVLLARPGPEFELLRTEMAAFRSNNAWVEESALFDVLRKQAGNEGDWWEWKAELRDRDPSRMAALRKEHAHAIMVFIAVQFMFDKQWKLVKKYANERGIYLIGDMPIYVGGQSADVWANRELFELGPTGEPEQVSGVPPDAFSATGQLWGSPLYKWPAHEAEGYRWWAQRIGRAEQVYDITRIDHFRAFTGYWSVDADAETAMNGNWRKGPGKAFFDAVSAALGHEPAIMAEDLGVITPDVVALRKEIDAPGMVVLQFAWGGGNANTHLPHNHYSNSFVYPGTHDNETAVGWYKDTATNQEKIYLQRYMGTKGSDIAWDFIQESMKSVSTWAMLMLQDVMRLDNEHRMNSPGKAEGNWAWRVPGGFSWNSLSKEAAELRTLAVMYDRCEEAKVEIVSETNGAAVDPLEEFCKGAPDADECRVYED